MEFQSLFFWKWGFKRAMGEKNFFETGFNPCFSGSGVLSSLYALILRHLSSFNPCFSGSGVLSSY